MFIFSWLYLEISEGVKNIIILRLVSGKGIIISFELGSKRVVCFPSAKCNFMLTLICVNLKYPVSVSIHTAGKQLIYHIWTLQLYLLTIYLHEYKYVRYHVPKSPQTD